MFRKKNFTPRFTSAIMLIIFSLLPGFLQADAESTSSLGGQGSQDIIHNSGNRISGLLITEPKPHHLGPVSAINLFSLQTKECGILDFQASPAGLICLNCRENTAVLKSCHIPRASTGWQKAS